MEELNGPQFEKIKEERFENKILVYPSIKYKIKYKCKKTTRNTAPANPP